ncbi:MAG TPA: MOSC domain-containing protein [Roseibacterium sp.]|nr:MOSC domain-containing protein [Roseibacterium sp.]
MAALIPTSFTARVIWLGVNRNREVALQSEPLTEMALSFAGFAGESHGGLTRASCSRVAAQYAPGTEIRNTRQISIVAQEDLVAIAAEIGLEVLDPALIGASMVVDGLPDFTHIPPGARLQDEMTGTALVVDMENRPCMLPARPIETVHPGKGRAFKAAAKGRRGVTAWVEREGTITVGATLRLHIPDQPVWLHLEKARAGAGAGSAGGSDGQDR